MDVDSDSDISILGEGDTVRGKGKEGKGKGKGKATEKRKKDKGKGKAKDVVRLFFYLRGFLLKSLMSLKFYSNSRRTHGRRRIHGLGRLYKRTRLGAYRAQWRIGWREADDGGEQYRLFSSNSFV